MTEGESVHEIPPGHSGLVDGPQIQMTLTEISLAQAVPVDRIVEMVWEGVIDPLGSSRDDWRFSTVHLRQIGIAVRLQRDLGVNLPGVALALQLLGEIQALRQAAR